MSNRESPYLDGGPWCDYLNRERVEMQSVLSELGLLSDASRNTAVQ
jgi:hypothetical protein